LRNPASGAIKEKPRANFISRCQSYSLYVPRANHFAENKVSKEQQIEEYGQGDIDPVTVKKMSAHERLAKEIKQSKIECEALSLGSHPIEASEYPSQLFSMSPRLLTNKGLVKIKGKNIDYVQILQMN
jgi:hypothetical protein